MLMGWERIEIDRRRALRAAQEALEAERSLWGAVFVFVAGVLGLAGALGMLG